MKISVVLPTFNEKDNIVPLIIEIIANLKKITRNYEIIVVDDNSPDNTANICKRKFIKVRQVKVIIRKKDKGFASAIMYGLKKASGDVVFVMDTDFSHDPKLMSKMASRVGKYQVVIGSRYVKNGGGENKNRYFLSKAYNIYLKHLLGIDISDFLFGYFCVEKKFLDENKLLDKKIFFGFGDYFIRFAYYVNKSGGTFFEIPAFYKNRTSGVSKSNLTDMLYTYTKTSIKLYFTD